MVVEPSRVREFDEPSGEDGGVEDRFGFDDEPAAVEDRFGAADDGAVAMAPTDSRVARHRRRRRGGGARAEAERAAVESRCEFTRRRRRRRDDDADVHTRFDDAPLKFDHAALFGRTRRSTRRICRR